LRFAYFGGGTPSYISEKQLMHLVNGLNRHVTWDRAEEVTFECEPGTLRRSKLEVLKDIGVTRLSLGAEHFDDELLAANGRAHLSPEIYDVYEMARQVDFPQINIDLIAGMVGETEAKWRDTVRKALELQPDSVTIYQMELPYNTIISREMMQQGVTSPIADWATKRRWLNYAFEQFQERGYEIASATTVATTRKPCRFIYTDALWHGGDMIGLGVSSFSHFGGVNFQNAHNFEEYVRLLNDDKLPLLRAVSLTPKQRLIREMILQLKRGYLNGEYFQDKFRINVLEQWAAATLAHPVQLLAKGRLQVHHDAGFMQQLAILRLEHRAAAGGQHDGLLLAQGNQCFALASPESGFTLAIEDVRDIHARLAFDLGIAVVKSHAQQATDMAAHGGLARAHGTYEIDVALAQHAGKHTAARRRPYAGFIARGRQSPGAVPAAVS
jgi:oxygen-independent coproporphyrinogen-3 oxidase